jgi:hypothetical protein
MSTRFSQDYDVEARLNDLSCNVQIPEEPCNEVFPSKYQIQLTNQFDRLRW